jgi:hypothetical protein
VTNNRTLESGFVEDKTHIRCQQIQCSFHIAGGCKSCETCDAPPHILKKTCSKCITCSTQPGELRWTDQKTLQDATDAKQYNDEILRQVEHILNKGESMQQNKRIIILENDQKERRD